MNSDWPRVRAAELEAAGVLVVQDGNHGEYRPRADEFVDEGIPFVRAADLADGRIRFDTASRINDIARRRITKGIGSPGDTIVSHKGTVGRVAWAPYDCEAFVCSPQTTFWRSLDARQLDPRYLYAIIRSPFFQAQLDSRKGESDMAPYVSLTTQRTLLIVLPPPREQRRIAGVLSALDDKIEHNRLVCRRLDAASRLLGSHMLSRARREGWPVSAIQEQVSIFGGATPSTREPAFWDGGYRFVTPKDLANLEFPVLLTTERTITGEGVAQVSSGQLPEGTLLLSSRAPIGYLAIAEVPLTVNQGFIAMVCDRQLSAHYVLQWARRNHDVIVAAANGTTFLEISKRAFRPLLIPVPPGPELQRFDAVADPLHRQLVALVKESETLVALRDALLPKLVSGAIRVPDSYDPDDALGTVAEAAVVAVP